MERLQQGATRCGHRCRACRASGSCPAPSQESVRPPLSGASALHPPTLAARRTDVVPSPQVAMQPIITPSIANRRSLCSRQPRSRAKELHRCFRAWGPLAPRATAGTTRSCRRKPPPSVVSPTPVRAPRSRLPRHRAEREPRGAPPRRPRHRQRRLANLHRRRRRCRRCHCRCRPGIPAPLPMCAGSAPKRASPAAVWGGCWACRGCPRSHCPSSATRSYRRRRRYRPQPPPGCPGCPRC
mmetsp:Transcript_63694/g.179781  ORF Transcript_63694/g.179781 Transcript_63694/m.179781 type:complete len:240 (-) Transcript_63694:247-966(-)